MSLTHVCIWDPQVGYRRVTLNEARHLHPYGASAKSGHFVCELCAQNVLLTSPGVNAQHFRHDPSSPNKECEERQLYFDPTYGRSLRSFNSCLIPLRVVKQRDNSFSLELGFLFPPDASAHCDKIKIMLDNHQSFEYSFERIGHKGITYLSVGSEPSSTYKIEYINANTGIKRFWANVATGVNSTGTFFDGKTGCMIQSGGKAYSENTYYLLQSSQILFNPDIEITEIARYKVNFYFTWYLYKIRVKRFSVYSARFFLKYAVFLTEKPTKFYPIWPPYIRDPYFIYHNANEFYFYLCGDDAELKSYPASLNVEETQDGKLYKLQTREREQLVSFGKSGALGFSYLIKKVLTPKVSIPKIEITDHEKNILTEDRYTTIPKHRFIFVTSQFDGKAVFEKKGRIEYIYKISSGQPLLIDNLSYGVKIRLFQGCDCIKEICFEKEQVSSDISVDDEELLSVLKSCGGPTIAVSHSMGSLVEHLAQYPKTKQWLYSVLRKGQISRKALQILKNTIHNKTRRE